MQQPGQQRQRKRKERCKHTMQQQQLPDGSMGDFLCSTCSTRLMSEDTVQREVFRYFDARNFATSLGNQKKHEGDVKADDRQGPTHWIIETKGNVPGGGERINFKTGLGQILKARKGRGIHFLYAIAMPAARPFLDEVTHIDDNDRQYLRLHWIWVQEHQGIYTLKLDCPLGAGCQCQQHTVNRLPCVGYL